MTHPIIEVVVAPPVHQEVRSDRRPQIPRRGIGVHRARDTIALDLTVPATDHPRSGRSKRVLF